MRPVNRYQSQLLPRRSYKPSRLNRNRLAPKPNRLFGSTRAGPELIIYEFESYPIEFRQNRRSGQSA